MKTDFKKLFASILACISIAPSINFKVGAVLHGSGSAEDPILISSANDWNEIGKKINQDPNFTLNKHFSITKDIILEKITNFSYWLVFYGFLHGNNHIIKTCEIDSEQTLSLIGCVSILAVIDSVNLDSYFMLTAGFYGRMIRCKNIYPVPTPLTMFIDDRYARMVDCSTTGKFNMVSLKLNINSLVMFPSSSSSFPKPMQDTDHILLPKNKQKYSTLRSFM